MKNWTNTKYNGYSEEESMFYHIPPSKTMKTPEKWAEELFGFTFIDDIEPRSHVIWGNWDLVDKIIEIQTDAYEAGMKYGKKMEKPTVEIN